MTQETAIKVRPPTPRLWHWPAMLFMSVVFPGCIFIAAFVMIAERITNYATPPDVKLALAVAGALLGVIAMALFLRWEQDRWHWRLTDDTLIGGRKQDKRFPFASIRKIVLGLPDQTSAVVAASAALRPELGEMLSAEKKLTLFLKFEDGSFMPLHLHRCSDGTRLMTELVRRLPDRVDSQYQYSEQEVKALKSADWNRLVRPK